MAALPTPSDQAREENAGRHAQQCPNNAPGNLVEGTRRAELAMRVLASRQVLLKCSSSRSPAINPRSAKRGKQNSCCVKVGLQVSYQDAASTKLEADAYVYPGDEQERDLHDAVERLRIPEAANTFT